MDQSVPVWDEPPEEVRLPGDRLHVWRAALDQPAAQVRRLLDTLSEDECARADSFRFKRDREHFIVARGVLRAILGRYLSTEPERLGFSYSRNGKPYLASRFRALDLRFNLSHSNGMALFAFSQGREVGIDIEWVREGTAREMIAERFFSPVEVQMLRQLPEELQDEGFFNCWTRKEAFIKATGDGLSMPLDEFTVTLRPGEPALILDIKGDPRAASRWVLRELAPGNRYAAAVVVEGSLAQLECLTWRDPDLPG